MSVVRQLIQISAVEAVRGKTLAGNDVFDSMIDDVTGLLKDKARPLMIFSVEECHQKSAGQGERGFLNRTTVLKFMVQLAVASGKEIRDGDDVVILTSIGDSDAAHEATLNILDREWRTALHDESNPWTQVFRGLVLGVGNMEDRRGADPETGRKHAARYLVADLSVIAEPMPGEELPSAIEQGLSLMEADDDAAYREVARNFRRLLGAGADKPDWQKLQSRLFLSDKALLALGHGPLIGDINRSTPVLDEGVVDFFNNGEHEVSQ